MLKNSNRKKNFGFLKFLKINTIKNLPVYILFLMLAFYTACEGQKQTNVPRDNTRLGYSEFQLKEAVTSKVPIGMVRNVKQDRNGNILIAIWFGSLNGVYRFDGKTVTDFKGKKGQT